MECTITIAQRPVLFTLKRRAYQRRVNMIVHQDGTFVVTAPKMMPLGAIERTLKKNESWIAQQIAKAPPRQNVTVDEKVVKRIKRATKKLVERKLKEFNSHYNFSFARVSIRAQKSRWGSCSDKGTLSFNVKIFCLPENLQDYIIVHELCHLGQMNHSPAFWELVGKTIPEHKTLRKELRNVTL